MHDLHKTCSLSYLFKMMAGAILGGISRVGSLLYIPTGGVKTGLGKIMMLNMM